MPNSELGDELENNIDAQLDEDKNRDSDPGSDSDNDRVVSRNDSCGSSSSDDDDGNNNKEKDESNRNLESGTRSLQGCIVSEEEENTMSLNPDYAWERIRASQIFLEPPVKRIPALTKEHCSAKKDFCRFVFISDTHGNHRHISHLPRGDVLVHAGDFSRSGETGSIQELSTYFRELVDANTREGSDKAHVGTRKNRPTFRKVICVAGNHDLTLDQEYYDREWQRFHRHGRKFDPAAAQTSIRRHAVYLHDEGVGVEFPFDDGANKNSCRSSNDSNSKTTSVHVWGSPYSPKFFNWAFNKERGSPIREIWDKIPSRESNKPVDVLITHGPPLGRGDLVFVQSGKHGGTTRAGCYDLLFAIQTEIQPKINVFGHIHEGYGVTYDGTTLYVNASTMNEMYEAVHLPIVIDIPLSSSEKSPCVIVQPSSLFRNNTTNINSLQEWIEWCEQHGHYCVAEALEDWFPEETAEEWFGKRKEPPPDRFFESLNGIFLEAYQQRPPSREFRQNLATMVFHLYALCFEG